MQTKNNKLLYSKIDDLYYKANRYDICVSSDFYSEEEQSIISTYLKNKPYQLDGGYPNAIRKRFIITNNYYDNEIVCLCANYRSNLYHLEHKDLLGSLMSLGISRAKFGDCFLIDDKIVAYVDASIADYVINNLNMIKRVSIKFTKSDIIAREDKFLEFQVSVASLRLDVLVAALAKTSRDKAKELILAQMVSINHQIVEDCSKICNNSSTIVIRRHGKFIIQVSGAISRKNKMILNIKQYL